ncbi:MAG: D-alanyl-D-alanine carboxypeptidase [Oculatellaceae cyanobacterium bins.114]|nr:D-alanyl-D-alanine carboxypeptidase [Oculatellaceae cyanobacterium bins.114]
MARVNGTWRNHFRNTPVQGRIHAKTGTLQGVRALSGNLENSSCGAIAFSIVVNQPRQSGAVMTQAIDQIVLSAAQVRRCGG